jgi:hypothetical protein
LLILDNRPHLARRDAQRFPHIHNPPGYYGYVHPKRREKFCNGQADDLHKLMPLKIITKEAAIRIYSRIGMKL